MWLRDCVSNDRLQAELLLVYSEAADEAAKIDRDRFTQATLQIDQSFVFSEELFVVLDNNQCLLLIAALGVGFLFGDQAALLDEPTGFFDITKLRYGRVIVVAEQGELGRKVRNDVLRFFFTYMRPLIDDGHIFVPETPLEASFTQNEFVEHILNPVTRRLRIVVGGDSFEDTLATLS